MKQNMKAELNNDFEVRTFTEEYRYEVASFLRDVLQEYKLLNDAGDLSSIMARISRRYSDENAGFWLLKRDNKIIGTVALRPHGEFTAEIERLYLKRRFRGRGIGTTLLKFVEDHAHKLGYRRLFVSCPKVMLQGNHFLEKADYRIVGNSQQESDDNLFEKELF